MTHQSITKSVKTGNYRWRIAALLFFATSINYIDRQVLGILAPGLQKELGWTETQYGLIVTIFQVAYATGFLFMGPLMDRLGNRVGY
ncbi:MAG TPA: MFS transporter, partial [Flavitalea sp.]|nr:MFS transporter [Flavitalea sp.]